MAGNDRSTRFAQLIGLELKGEFAKHGVSQSKVAESLRHSKTSYSKWMNAKPSMPMEAFLNTCEFIHVDPRKVMDAAYSRLLSEMGLPSENEKRLQDEQSPVENIAHDDLIGERHRPSDIPADFDSWSKADQATYIAANPEKFDLAAKYGDTEAEQEAYEQLP